jgi:predicted aldo/keto reductase-like oxidoreductase
MEHLELDVAVLDRPVMALTPEEEAEVERWRAAAEKQTCHICDRVCQAVCEPGLPIDHMLYHDVFQNELRRLGVQGFIEYPFAAWVREQAEPHFSHSLARLQTCTRCGKCEAVCPYHLPIMDMLEQLKQQKTELLAEIRKANASGNATGRTS